MSIQHLLSLTLFFSIPIVQVQCHPSILFYLFYTLSFFDHAIYTHLRLPTNIEDKQLFTRVLDFPSSISQQYSSFLSPRAKSLPGRTSCQDDTLKVVKMLLGYTVFFFFCFFLFSGNSYRIKKTRDTQSTPSKQQKNYLPKWHCLRTREFVREQERNIQMYHRIVIDTCRIAGFGPKLFKSSENCRKQQPNN